MTSFFCSIRRGIYLKMTARFPCKFHMFIIFLFSPMFLLYKSLGVHESCPGTRLKLWEIGLGIDPTKFHVEWACLMLFHAQFTVYVTPGPPLGSALRPPGVTLGSPWGRWVCVYIYIYIYLNMYRIFFIILHFMMLCYAILCYLHYVLLYHII